MICAMSLIGSQSVLYFRGEITTNEGRSKSIRRATSSVWNFSLPVCRGGEELARVSRERNIQTVLVPQIHSKQINLLLKTSFLNRRFDV